MYVGQAVSGYVPVFQFLPWIRVSRARIKPGWDLCLRLRADVLVSYCESISSLEFNPSQWKCWRGICRQQTWLGMLLASPLLLTLLHFFCSCFQYSNPHLDVWASLFRMRVAVPVLVPHCQWKQVLPSCCVQPHQLIMQGTKRSSLSAF